MDNLIDLQIEMISANCNSTLNAINYSKSWNVIAFASANLIHIYDCVLRKTVLTLKGHTARVNSVKWINCLTPLIASIGSDGKCIIWSCLSKERLFDAKSWIKISEIKSNQDLSSINTFDVQFDESTEEGYIAIFDENLELTLYAIRLKQQCQLDYELKSKLKVKYIVVSVEIGLLGKNLLMATGGYDSKINIYTYDISSFKSELKYHLSLLGHQNAIRDVSFNNKKNVALFGSASQDSYVRLWSIKQLSDEENTVLKTKGRGDVTVFDEYKAQTSYILRISDVESYHILLESILSDHEESVSSVRFIEDHHSETKILTSSFDFTVGLWGYKHVIFKSIIFRDIGKKKLLLEK